MKNSQVLRTAFQTSKLFSRALKIDAKECRTEPINSNLGEENETTHFGFKTVKVNDKAKQGKIFLIIYFFLPKFIFRI